MNMSPTRTPRSQGEIIHNQITRNDSISYLTDIGFSELIGNSEQDLNWLVNDTPDLANDKHPNGAKYQRGKLHNLKLEPHLSDFAQELILDVTVVPYGAGSSFLGFLQKVHRDYTMGCMDYDPLEIVKNRSFNLWDNDYGIVFRAENTAPGTSDDDLSNRMARCEDLVKQALSGFITWNQVHKEYVDMIKYLYSIKDQLGHTNNGEDQKYVEVAVHDFPFTLDWLIPNLHVKTFVDCGYQTFAWCYLLSQMKHDRPAFRDHAGRDNDPDYRNSFRSAIFEVNRYWHVYQLCKKYFPIQSIQSYNGIFVDHDPNSLAEFLNVSCLDCSSVTADELNMLMPLVKEYSKSNQKILPQKIVEKYWKNPYHVMDKV